MTQIESDKNEARELYRLTCYFTEDQRKYINQLVHSRVKISKIAVIRDALDEYIVNHPLP